MKKTVWKPTKEELEEMGFTGEYDSYPDQYQFWYVGDLELTCYFNDWSTKKTEGKVEFFQNDSTPIYPRSKEELQAFISMFEEDETTTVGNT